MPRFQGENFQKNLDLVAEVEKLAKQKQCTAAQLALAWVQAQGDDVVPIFGAKTRKHLEDSVGAVDVKLAREDLARLDRVLPPGVAAGTRYHAQGMQTVNR